jgi:hypothetical protein
MIPGDRLEIRLTPVFGWQPPGLQRTIKRVLLMGTARFCLRMITATCIDVHQQVWFAPDGVPAQWLRMSVQGHHPGDAAAHCVSTC